MAMVKMLSCILQMATPIVFIEGVAAKAPGRVVKLFKGRYAAWLKTGSAEDKLTKTSVKYKTCNTESP